MILFELPFLFYWFWSSTRIFLLAMFKIGFYDEKISSVCFFTLCHEREKENSVGNNSNK